MIAFPHEFGVEKCHCAACEQGMEKVREQETKWLKTVGWYAHNTPDSYHTHGLMESFGHPDIQVVLPIDPRVIHQIVSGFVHDIRDGKRFEAGKRYGEVIEGYDVTFITAREGDRDVLRLIFPDSEGHLEEDELTGLYQEQYKGV